MTMHLGAEKLAHIGRCEVCKARLQLFVKYDNANKAVSMAKPSKEVYTQLAENCTEAKGLI